MPILHNWFFNGLSVVVDQLVKYVDPTVYDVGDINVRCGRSVGCGFFQLVAGENLFLLKLYILNGSVGS
jgi:hypothetical protein